MSTEQLPSEIVSVIPAHLDSAHVRWLAGLCTKTLESLLRSQCDMDRYARARDTAKAQSIQFVLRERGPIAERLKAAQVAERAARRAHDTARAAADLAWERVLAAQVARLQLEQIEEEQQA